mgnify:CR=1 FL=1
MNSPKLLISAVAAVAAGFVFAQSATPGTTPSTSTAPNQGQVTPSTMPPAGSTTRRATDSTGATPAPASPSSSTMERTNRDAATGTPARNADGSVPSATERAPRADRN